jgi:hypothetical protein
MKRDNFIYVLCVAILVSWISFLAEMVYIVKEIDKRAEEQGYVIWEDVKYYPLEEVINNDK